MRRVLRSALVAGIAAALFTTGCSGTDGTPGEEALGELNEGLHKNKHKKNKHKKKKNKHKNNDLADEVRELAESHNITPIPPAPEVRDELFFLGQALMFDMVLAGDNNTSCMTCHFPTLHTDDNRALALGVGGMGLGAERVGGAVHVRHSLPLFNLHAIDRFFWDMRLGNVDGEIVTPARDELTPELRASFEFGAFSSLGMFPVIERTEMRGQRFFNEPNLNELAGDLERAQIWEGLMARLGAIPEYVEMFEAAYPGEDFGEMNFGHAGNAMAGFMIRAFEFRNSPFQQFLRGNDHALSLTELKGARIFLEEGCANCHNGPMLTDQRVHNTGLAQFGPGVGDGQWDHDDFGRAGAEGPFDRGTGTSARDRFQFDDLEGAPPHEGAPGNNPLELFAFRTAPLNNITLTAPFGHNGQFSNLRDFVSHYNDPAAQLLAYDMAAQIHPNESFFLDMRVPNTDDVLPRIDPTANVPVSNLDHLLAFLETLTDDAARDLTSITPARVPSDLPLFEDPPIVTGAAKGTVTFANIAKDPASGLVDYRRVPSERNAIAEFWQEKSLTERMDFFQIFETPLRWRGLPGIAIFDFDNDGDEDVFVTNGPGAPNSLFVNEFAQTGKTRFSDRAVQAGVALEDRDSSGVCFGDIDNDGDHDLYVVADNGPSSLFLNNGDGTFYDNSDLSGANPVGTGGTSCAFGDINGDGLLDLFVARAWHQDTVFACFTDPFGAGIQHNELYINEGGGVFSDISDASGIRNIGGLPPFAAGAPTITWSVSLVDYDQDGDVDIFTADDQCGMPPADIGGIDRGFLQIFDNDGTGNFTNRTVEAGTNQPSAWMGLSFGDFNSDGHLDFFSPSFGDWGKPFAGAPVILGYETSRWLLGAPGKVFTTPGVGDLVRMPFGWGTSARDFDNDGDTDLTFHGGLDLWFHVDKSNPGSMLLNDGNANFGLDRHAYKQSHSRRNDAGVAVADLNQDGFDDVVSISNFDIPAKMPIFQYGSAALEVQFYSVFDPVSFFVPTFDMIEIGAESPNSKIERLFSWDPDFVYDNGTIAVELNSANNKNRWVSIRLVGAVDLISGGKVNRDAIGAMVYFTPKRGRTVMAPVLGGSSHLSQDSLTQGFGLGRAKEGTLEILWPGGTRNRLYDVEHRERLTIPELPCSYDTSDSWSTYRDCVDDALDELREAGLVDRRLARRMEKSAHRAYWRSR